MKNNISRRAALAALAGAGALVSAPAMALVEVNTRDAAAWAKALAEYDAAVAAKDAYQPTYDRILAAYEAGRPAMDTIPWNEFPFENRHNVARSMDVEKRWTFFLGGEGIWWWAPGREEARKAEYRAALDAVLEFRRKEAEHHDASGMTEAEETNDTLWERTGTTERALLDMPAPHGEALLWKMENLWLGDEEAGFCADWVSLILSDARRLLSNGSA